MSEIREELEHFARLAEEKEANENAKVSQSEESNDNFEAVTTSSEDEYLAAPKGYQKEFAETFKDLPLNWRRYLSAREEEIDKGFSNLHSKAGAYKWLDNIYDARLSEMQKNGIKSPQDWVNNMVKIDAMLSSAPADAIKLLADAYNVNIATPTAAASQRPAAKTMADILSDQIVCQQVKDFAHATDDSGNQKHPFFGEVVKNMADLLSKGVVDNLDDAYEAAVWFNSATRDKLIAKRSQEALEQKSKNAQKAKEVSFSPKGKAMPEKRDLTLREELEMRFAALDDDD